MHNELLIAFTAKVIKLVRGGQVFFFLKIYIALFWVVLASIIVNAQTGLVIEPKTIALGKVNAGSIKRINFSLINKSNDTIHIYAINSSCGCSVVKRHKKFLPPGDFDSVEVEFNTLGYRGVVKKSVEIISDDTNASIQYVIFETEVFSNIETSFRGDVFWIGNISVNTTTEKMFSLKNNTNENIFVTSLTSRNNIISFSVEDSLLKPLDSIVVTIKVTPVERGLASEEIAINTSNRTQPTLRLFVTYNAIK